MSSGQSISHKPSRTLLIVTFFFAISYILFPLWMLIRESLGGGTFSLDAYGGLLHGSFAEATLNSLLISLMSVMGSAIIGTFFAYVLAFVDFPAKRLISVALLVPLALPPLVGVISFLFLIGESGMLSRLLSSVSGLPSGVFTVNGWTGIVIIHVYSFYVYFYLLVSSALSQLDGNLLDASASLGAGRFRTMTRVLLPMLMPSLVAASLITFMASMASFTAPLLFGGNTRFLTLEIYAAKLNGDDASSAALSVFLALLSVGLLFLLRWWQGRRPVVMESKSARPTLAIQHGSFVRRTLIALLVCAAILLALPIVTVVLLSFVKEGSWTYQIFPSTFTPSNYAELFNRPGNFDPLLNSLRMSLFAVAMTLFVGVAGAYLVTRKRFAGRGLLEAALSIPFGIPGTVIAVGLILSLGRPTPFSFGSILVGTFWIMPIAYAVRNVPLQYRSAVAGLESLPSSLQEAADVLGSSPLTTFRRITLPLLLPSIISGALLVFVNSAGEFVSSILLYSYGTRPVSIEILSQLRLFNIGAASVQSTVLMALVAAVVVLSRKFLRSSILS